MRTAEQNRLRQATRAVSAGLQAHVRYLQAQIDEIDTSIGESIKADPAWEDAFGGSPEHHGGGTADRPGTDRTTPGTRSTFEETDRILGRTRSASSSSGTVKGARTIFGGRRTVRTAPCIWPPSPRFGSTPNCEGAISASAKQESLPRWPYGGLSKTPHYRQRDDPRPPTLVANQNLSHGVKPLHAG